MNPTYSLSICYKYYIKMFKQRILLTFFNLSSVFYNAYNIIPTLHMINKGLGQSSINKSTRLQTGNT